MRNRRVAVLLGLVAALLVSITVVSVFATIRIARARDEAEHTAQRERETAERERAVLTAEKQSLVKAQAAERLADEARRTAETHAAAAAQVSDFLVNLFLTADPWGTGKLGFRQGEEIGKDFFLTRVTRSWKPRSTADLEESASRARDAA